MVVSYAFRIFSNAEDGKCDAYERQINIDAHKECLASCAKAALIGTIERAQGIHRPGVHVR